MPSRTLAALLYGGLLALPVAAADATKDVNGDNLPSGQFTGKLVNPLDSDGSFTLKVEIDRAQVNPGAANATSAEVRDVLRDQERINRIENDMARTANPKRLNQLQQKLADALIKQRTHAVLAQAKSAGEVTIVKDYKNVDFHSADDVKVRTMNTPVQFDDKGNPKQYTKDELKALKGADVDLPGYESTTDALKPGDTLQVTLKTPKPAKKDANNDPKADPDAKPAKVVTLIVVVASSDQSDSGKKK